MRLDQLLTSSYLFSSLIQLLFNHKHTNKLWFYIAFLPLVLLSSLDFLCHCVEYNCFRPFGSFSLFIHSFISSFKHFNAFEFHFRFFFRPTDNAAWLCSFSIFVRMFKIVQNRKDVNKTHSKAAQWGRERISILVYLDFEEWISSLFFLIQQNFDHCDISAA